MIAAGEIVRGALRRFVPTVLAVMGLIAVPSALVAGGGFHAAGLAMGASEIAGLTIGFAGALLVVRRWLRDDAGVSGRRANVAALGSVLALLTLSIVLVQYVSPLRAFVLSTLAGGAVTAGLFAPWLTRRGKSATVATDAGPAGVA